jgi:hypothetical protein
MIEGHRSPNSEDEVLPITSKESDMPPGCR